MVSAVLAGILEKIPKYLFDSYVIRKDRDATGDGDNEFLFGLTEDRLRDFQRFVPNVELCGVHAELSRLKPRDNEYVFH